MSLCRTSRGYVCDTDFNFAALFSVEAIDRCVRNLNTGKACGPDNLSVQHLLYAHPFVMVHLKLLFYFIVTRRLYPMSLALV